MLFPKPMAGINDARNAQVNFALCPAQFGGELEGFMSFEGL